MRIEKGLILHVIEKNGKEYKVYGDGKSEGFGDNPMVSRHFKVLLATRLAQQNLGIDPDTLEELFVPFPKMARLSREVVITEKLDGTNACVYITEDGQIRAGSRTRWITPQDDNFGFAAWAEAHRDELLTLGPGRHFGEWWGKDIQRNYGLNERRFSLFNIQRWCLFMDEPKPIKTGDPRIVKMQDVLPPCCGLVPVLYRGEFDTDEIEGAIDGLRRWGSVAAQGFMDPEGAVIFHMAAGIGFKKTLKHDDQPKSFGAAFKVKA